MTAILPASSLETIAGFNCVAGMGSENDGSSCPTTAQELGNHLAERLGWQPLEDHSGRLPSWEAQEIQPPGFQDFSQPDRVVVQGEVADREAAKRTYRDFLRRQMAQNSDGIVSIVTSVEGIGKTTACLPMLADQALEDAMAHNDGVERFAGFAFRSRNQAKEKVQEFGRTHQVRVIKTFWEHYGDACLAEGESPIPRDELDDANASDILHRIRLSQPEVFGRLERTRANPV